MFKLLARAVGGGVGESFGLSRIVNERLTHCVGVRSGLSTAANT